MHQFYKKELSRVKAWLLLSLLSIATIAGCSNTAIEHHKILTAKPTSTSCRIVHHTMGETCIPNNPKRIITIPFSTLSDTLVLDFQPIASTSSFATKEELTAKYLSTKTYLGNRTKGINHIGRTYTTPNIERMLLLKPDLILAWDRLSRIYPLLSKIAPTVMVPWQTPFHWENSFNFIAEALEKKETAQRAWNHYYQRIEKLKIALGNRYQDKVISIIGAFGLNSINAYTKNSFSGSILNTLELKLPLLQNVITPNGAIYNISEERLEQLDGDILFFLMFGNYSTESFEKLRQRPLWKTLKAAQKGQVYLVDGDTWGGSSLLAADAVIDDLYKYLVNKP